MCAPSSTTFRGKVLRVGLAGIKPNVFKARNGRPDGVDVRILGLLQRKLKFRANVKIIRTLQSCKPRLNIIIRGGRERNVEEQWDQHS